MVQAFKVGDRKIKNGLDIKCVNRKYPNFDLSDIFLLSATQKKFIRPLKLSVAEHRDRLHICVDQAFKDERGEKILLDKNAQLEHPDHYRWFKLYFLISFFF